MAPGTLVGPGVSWNQSTSRARLTQRGHTVTATLFFAADGRLVNFESDDRARPVPDSRFSTPLRDYRDFGPLYLAGYGEARWRLPEGEFTYGEFTISDVGRQRDKPRARADAVIERGMAATPRASRSTADGSATAA